MTAEVVLNGESLTPADVVAVARNGATVTVADTARERIRESRERVESVLDSGEAVYGVTTVSATSSTSASRARTSMPSSGTSSGATPPRSDGS